MFERRRTRDFAKAQRRHRDWPVVLAEGDSWFSFSDIVARLDNPRDRDREQRAWALLRRDGTGDEVMSILSGGQRAILRKDFRRWRFDAILFSAGANDIIGPDLLPLLRPFRQGMEARDVVSFGRFERRLRQIQDCYRELLDLLEDAGQNRAKIFVNSYDYAIPSDNPVRLIGIRLAGPWLKPYLEERNIPEDLYQPVVRLLVDGFVASVDAIAAESRGSGRLIRVETRNLLEARHWKDEIHPNRDGAFIVAKAFEQALADAGISTAIASHS